MEAKNKDVLKFDFLTNYMSLNIRRLLLSLSDSQKATAQEIRLRVNSPVMLSTQNRNVTVSDSDKQPYIVTREDIAATFEYVCSSSVHSVMEQLKNGFVTIAGGHRVGLCGRTVIKEREIFTLKDISSINFRISREFIGCSDGIIDQIISDGHIKNTLIISPPSCGKTTLLRDIARQLSSGVTRLSFPGVRVGIVDERCEIGGTFKGAAQNDIGPQTDILDACPKALGIMLLLRCMSPQVIITDELGTAEDIEAVCSANNTGVGVIASVHGDSISEITKKSLLKPLFENRVFELAFLLDNKNKIGNISQIYSFEQCKEKVLNT